jgi:hypothetical protein
MTNKKKFVTTKQPWRTFQNQKFFFCFTLTLECQCPTETNLFLIEPPDSPRGKEKILFRIIFRGAKRTRRNHFLQFQVGRVDYTWNVSRLYFWDVRYIYSYSKERKNNIFEAFFPSNFKTFVSIL